MTEDRVLVAGVGNVFLGDDGFGVAVLRHLAGRSLPARVQLFDVGTRAVHLAYELLDGCALLVLVDAAARGDAPGTVSLLEVGGGDLGPAPVVVDAHGLAPHDVLAMVRRMGAQPARTLVVTCEPADLGPGMELSDPVRAAVPQAAFLIESILAG